MVLVLLWLLLFIICFSLSYITNLDPDMLLSIVNNYQSFVFPSNITQAIPVHLIIQLSFWGVFIFIAYLKHIFNQKPKFSKLKKDINFPIKTMGIKQNRVLQIDKLNDALTLPHLLLSLGRKTIATVVQIQYIPTLKQNVEMIESKHFKTTKRAAHYSCHGKPNFIISYKFNPPDDAREEDILHTIITHTNVFSHLKIGDPLPILYCIVRNDRNREEFVTSLPFPYPLQDPIQITDLICADSVAVRLFKSAQISSHIQTQLCEKHQNGEEVMDLTSCSELDYLFKEFL